MLRETGSSTFPKCPTATTGSDMFPDFSRPKWKQRAAYVRVAVRHCTASGLSTHARVSPFRNQRLAYLRGRGPHRDDQRSEGGCPSDDSSAPTVRCSGDVSSPG